MNGEHGEAQLPAIFEHGGDGGLTQIGGRPGLDGRPPQRLSEESRKIVLAIFAALDLKASNDVRTAGFQPGTMLWMLEEFAAFVRCIDPEFAELLTPDNLQKAMTGGQS